MAMLVGGLLLVMLADAFGVKEKLNKRQCPLLSEYKGHPSIEKWVKKGYRLLIF